MSIVDDLDEACLQLAADASPTEIVGRWGTSREGGTRLLLVAPRDPAYEEIQILVGSTGHVTHIVFDLTSVSPSLVHDLTGAYGSPSEALPFGGPPTLWFTPPKGQGCQISAALASYARDERTTRQVSVVAPYRA